MILVKKKIIRTFPVSLFLTVHLQVQAYSPGEKVWSVEESLTSPRHKSCAVTIDDNIVVTGGTMLGLGKVKPVWLAEIGTRTAEMFNGETAICSGKC